MNALGPLDHISRRRLPWRTEADLTECGKPIRELAGRVVTREEVERRVKQIGRQRTAFSTCMTCADTSNRWTSDRRGSATSAVGREAAAVEHIQPPHHYSQDRERAQVLWNRRQRFEAELEAIAALVAAHREEFDGYLAGVGDTVSLDDRRRTRKAAW